MANDDLEKVTIRLTRGAKEELQAMFPNVGYNIVIRKLTDNFIKGVKEKASRNIKGSDITVEINEEELNDID